jgi:MerR family transcriptional regulator, light-induced transcriptional regulator
MENSRQSELKHPIRVVSRRTGLSASVLRAWERRYEAVEPERSDGGQRLYSDADIQRLTMLKRLVEGGRSISRIANLPLEDLRELMRKRCRARAPESPG